jgi:hypothetical protein
MSLGKAEMNPCKYSNGFEMGSLQPFWRHPQAV